MKCYSWLLTVAFSVLTGHGAPRADDGPSEAVKALERRWDGVEFLTVRSGPSGKQLTSVTHRFLQCDGTAYFFIAGVDLSSDFKSLRGGPLAGGVYKAADGASIRYSCETLDGKACEVKIGGKRYDPKDGPVFWVFRTGGRWEVYQAKVDPKVLQQQSESQLADAPFQVLRAVAKSQKALAEYAKAINLKVE